MAGTVEQKLAAQGVVLHEPASPVANYVGFVRTGYLLFVCGQVCFDPQGKLIAKGKLGAGVTVEQGNAAARGCAINLLAQIKAALGDLDKVVRVVRLGGFVNSAPDFLDGPKVLNGYPDELERIKELLSTAQELWRSLPDIEDEGERVASRRATFALVHLADIISVTPRV